MTAPTKSPKLLELYEIHLTVRGGENEFGHEFGDHLEIYRPEGTPERVCPDCQMPIPPGWAPSLERIRQRNGAEALSCVVVLVDPETGDRQVTSHRQLPANMAKDFLKKGKDVIDVSGQAETFYRMVEGAGSAILASNARRGGK